MRKSIFILILIPILVTCSHKDNKAASESAIKKEVMDIAIKYAMGKFNDAKETVGRFGIVTVVDNKVNFVTKDTYQSKYVIDPLRIMIGLIDDDQNEDAIITIYNVNGQKLETPEHLIIIKTEGKYILNRVIESNMKVLGVKDRIITAEVSTRSPNTPLRDCSECKEVVKYQFRAGDLIRIE
jgi:hypothetical protein